MGVQKSEKMPKFNQKSTILKIFWIFEVLFQGNGYFKVSHQWEPESNLGRLYKTENLNWFRFMYFCQGVKTEESVDFRIYRVFFPFSKQNIFLEIA